MNPSSNIPTKKLCEDIFLVFVIVVLLGMIACGNQQPSRSTPRSQDRTTESIMELNEEKVKKLVQQYVAISGGTVTLQVSYLETITQKVICHGDPQVQGCYEDDFSPTGFSKNINQPVRRCCRSEQRSIPSRASWKIVYDKPSEKWEVKVEFELEDIQQLIKWTVDDDTQEVSRNDNN